MIDAKQSICNEYQKLIRQAYPRAVVLPNANEWNPYRDECYNVFFIPDNSGVEYLHHWIDDGGWYEQAEDKGLPYAAMLEVNESDTREHYSHLFPEIFGEKVVGSAKSKKSKTVAKPAKTRVARTKTAASKN